VVWRPPPTFSYTEALKLARSIERQAGIRAYLRERQYDVTGEHEVEWDGGSDRKLYRAMLYLIPGSLMPYAGFAIRTITGNTVVIIASGIVLLGSAQILLWRGSKLQPAGSANDLNGAVSLSLMLLFGLMYTCSVLVAAALFARRVG
jgi:hypothetical protein